MVRNGRVKLWQYQLTPRRLAADSGCKCVSGCVHTKSDDKSTAFILLFSVVPHVQSIRQRLSPKTRHSADTPNPSTHLYAPLNGPFHGRVCMHLCHRLISSVFLVFIIQHVYHSTCLLNYIWTGIWV